MEKMIAKYCECVCPCSCCGCSVERVDNDGITKPWCTLFARFMRPMNAKCKHFTLIKEGEDND